jgi:hypothetical protein
MGETSLLHYGILGMKWGVRRKNPSVQVNSHPAPVTRPKLVESNPVVPDRNVSGTLRPLINVRNPPNVYTDAELSAITKRLQLEKQYRDLTKTEVSAGKKFVNEVLQNSAKQTATAYVTKYMTKGIDEAIKRLSK